MQMIPEEKIQRSIHGRLLFSTDSFSLCENSADIDLLRVIRMLSIHDLVEIEAGDTFLFDEAAMVGKFEREKLLLRRSSEFWMNLCVQNF
jgi:hypothetical protein